MLPTLFCVAFLILCASSPGHSNDADTLQCHEDEGTCHPTICPVQKMSQGTCYNGAQLCCVDCPEFFLSYEGNGAICRPRFGLRDSIKLLREKGFRRREFYKKKGLKKTTTAGSQEAAEEENTRL